jgi:transcriptional regulator with XRE-family HTH domain
VTGPSILRRRLGRELRALRETRSLRLEDVAAYLGVAPSTLSRIETGRAPTRTSYLSLMLDLYGVDDNDERRRLTDIAREGQRKGWWSDHDDLLPAGAGQYIGLESAAALVRSWSLLTVPALLQTRDYAETVIRATRPTLTDAEVRQLTSIQMRRQELARSSGRRLHALIDQAALIRPVARPEAMAGQLRHLTALADDLVTVQVTPLADPLPVLALPFSLLSFAGPEDPGVACCAGIGGQVLVTQHAEWFRILHAAWAVLAITALSPSDSADLIAQLTVDAGFG